MVRLIHGLGADPALAASSGGPVTVVIDSGVSAFYNCRHHFHRICASPSKPCLTPHNSVLFCRDRSYSCWCCSRMRSNGARDISDSPTSQYQAHTRCGATEYLVCPVCGDSCGCHDLVCSSGLLMAQAAVDCSGRDACRRCPGLRGNSRRAHVRLGGQIWCAACARSPAAVPAFSAWTAGKIERDRRAVTPRR